MSKERFVKIKRLKKIKLDNEKYHQEHVLSKEILDDIKWLIEQAERVEELEFRNEITENRNYKLEQTFKDYQQVNKNMYDMIGDLKLKNLKIEQQSKRYREALEFYAEQDNYEWETSYRPQQEIDCMVIDDGGHTARKALEGEE